MSHKKYQHEKEIDYRLKEMEEKENLRTGKIIPIEEIDDLGFIRRHIVSYFRF